MEFLEHFRFLYDGVAYFFKTNPVLTEDGVQMVPGWKYLVMFLIGGVLIYLALVKDFEPPGFSEACPAWRNGWFYRSPAIRTS